MAKKPETFKLNLKKHTITLYTNVEEIQAEKDVIEYYLKQGYTPLFEEKKKGLTIQEMRDKLKEKDETILEQFNKAYSQKNGFFEACKIYNQWKREQKKSK